MICQGQLHWWCNWVYKRHKKIKTCYHAILTQTTVNNLNLFYIWSLITYSFNTITKIHTKHIVFELRHRVCKKTLGCITSFVDCAINNHMPKQQDTPSSSLHDFVALNHSPFSFVLIGNRQWHISLNLYLIAQQQYFV